MNKVTAWSAERWKAFFGRERNTRLGFLEQKSTAGVFLLPSKRAYKYIRIYAAVPALDWTENTARQRFRSLEEEKKGNTSAVPAVGVTNRFQSRN
jgi:hypothetical protein